MNKPFRLLQHPVAGHPAVKDAELAREPAGHTQPIGRVRIVNRTIVGCDAAFAQMFGYATEELLGKSMRLLHPTDQSYRAFSDAASPVIDCGDLFRIEQQHLRKDGSLGWYDVSLAMVGPDSLELRGAFIDTTARHRELRDLAIAEEHYRTLFNAMAEGVVVHAQNGQIIESNPAAERILGLTRSQLWGKTPRHPQWQAIREDGTPLPGEEHPASVSLRTGQAVRQRIMGIRARGAELRWISIDSQPVFETGQSAPSAAIVTFNDVTALCASLVKTRELARHLEDIRDEERKKIAHALDEEISQELFAARLMVDHLKVRGGGGPPGAHDRLWHELTGTIAACMSSTRDIANEVRPFAVALDLAEWRPKYRQEATVLIPVTCPQCGEASLSAHPVIVVVTALTRWNRMLLRAACHEQAWDATHAELQAIREHLGEDWISKNAKSSGTR